MKEKLDIHKAAGILIKGRKLLVEKSFNKDFYIAPGGSIEEGESVVEALERKLEEEFDIETHQEDYRYFDTFTAQAAGQEDKIVQMEVYFVDTWDGEPTPNSEVENVQWISSAIPQGMKAGSIFEHDVIPRLKELDLID